MTILVTGGSGFIGRHVVATLVAAGGEVRVLDRVEAPVRVEGAHYVTGDVRDRDTLERCLAGAGDVCHLAAKVGLGVDMSDLTEYASHNDLGTAALLEALAGSRFGGRLVLSSSMVVYGEGRYSCERHGERAAPAREPADLAAGGFEPRCPDCNRELEPLPIGEDAQLAPVSVYAATKVHQEHLAFAFSRETGVPVTALRYHNVYGPGMPRDTPYAGVAAIFASALARGQAPRVFEDGCQRRDFVHVRDVARANLLALETPDPYVGALNVASGSPRTVGQMALALASAAGPDAPSPVVTGEWRAGDVRHVFASPRRASSELGFRAAESFEAGMRELWAAPRGLNGV
ncbi:MAG TPA: NAD-dependent epimerase/dehydratase family protein [Thermoleophilaceae bacterium]